MTDKTPQQILAEADAHDAAAFPGPWWWGGNTDYHGDVALHGPSIGYGVMDVMRPTPEILTDEQLRAEYRADPDLADYMSEGEYVDDRERQARSYLAFLRPDTTFVEPGRDVAIYEVARRQGLPDDTPRTHPKVYRADVVGIRNPNAEFIAWARTAVPALAEALRAALERAEAAETKLREAVGRG